MFIRWINKSRLSDNELLVKFRQTGDAAYYSELFKRHTYYVLGICMKYLRDVDESKDAVMEIFEKQMTEIAQQDIVQLERWLYTVTKNYCLKRLRKERRIFLNQAGYKFFLEGDMESEQNGGHNDNEEELKNLREALTKLNAEQKQCVELFYLQGKSYHEIEIVTGYSARQVKSFIQNGKRNLKIYLEKKNEQQ